MDTAQTNPGLYALKYNTLSKIFFPDKDYTQRHATDDASQFLKRVNCKSCSTRHRDRCLSIWRHHLWVLQRERSPVNFVEYLKLEVQLALDRRDILPYLHTRIYTPVSFNAKAGYKPGLLTNLVATPPLQIWVAGWYVTHRAII